MTMLAIGTYTSSYRDLNYHSKVKVQLSLYRPGVASKVPGS